MKATKWEFENRAWLFGLIFAVAFPLYWIDPKNSTETLAQWIAPGLGGNEDLVLRLLFAIASVLLMAAAFVRTWASSYLYADVVYAPEVKTAALVADGPYRRARNPLYFGNILMMIAMGAMMSRSGFFVAVVLMVVFSYRLIFREEEELAATQGETYNRYRKTVPRLWPSLRARVPASGKPARWAAGFKAEAWYWGFALSLVAFSITLTLKLFFLILGASVALLWANSLLLQKKSDPQGK